MAEPIMIPMDKPPKVLLLGNGLLRAAGGDGWDQLLKKIGTQDTEAEFVRETPVVLRTELLCGTDVEKIRNSVAEQIKTADVSKLPRLRQLLAMDWDCILTTNYAYEVEEILLGKDFTETRRKKAVTNLRDGASRQDNVQLCYTIERKGHKPVQVWHIHGDVGRPSTLTLSHYSYAKAISRLLEMNAARKNAYQEHQEAGKDLQAASWLDWFIMGDVHCMGFGFDFAEFDIWWAIERKARENARHGDLYCHLTDQHTAKAKLLERMGAKVEVAEVADWDGHYARALANIEKKWEPGPC